MTESFLQFLWQQQLIKKDNLLTVRGEKLEIVASGQRNTNSGPDFTNSKIKIDGRLWAGTVEIHIKSSDWIKHNHSIDRAYDNVILHVVAEHDVEIVRASGEVIPTFVFEIDKKLFDNYMRLITNKGPIPCADFLPEIDNFYIKHWQNRLVVDRLRRKSEEVLAQLKQNENSWEETFYQFLGKNFGFKQNALPFDLLTKSLPLKAIDKQKDSIFQIEAMLFGQAGFLDDDCNDKYFQLLMREYLFLKSKYSLTPLRKHLWKFMRMRPTNFPTLRIAQFSAILFKNYHLFSKIIETKDVKILKTLFEVSTSEYWETHFTFGKESKKTTKNIGNLSIDILLINTVVLFLFSYGEETQQEEYKERALELLESIKSEKNNIIEKWSGVGVICNNAFESQAQIELFNEYCSKGKCVECNIGAKIIVNEYF
ncbi:MAG: DUF2851 family protein [Bacteroidales bacterium]|nr:DUF2851 family protein [Bacteroidales bacterium]